MLSCFVPECGMHMCVDGDMLVSQADLSQRCVQGKSGETLLEDSEKHVR